VEREVLGAAMSPVPPYPPQQAGDYWVLPTIDSDPGDVVQMHVSMTVQDENDLTASDVRVRVIAGNQSLTLSAAPPPGPLPTLRAVGVNAYGLYEFANPDQLDPSTVVVTVKGQSATFDVSGSIT
jgi:hypothetical protein